MKPVLRVVIVGVLVAAINAATIVVVTWNQELQVYPPQGDSIAIPIGNTLVLSAMGAPYLLLLALLGRIRRVHVWIAGSSARKAAAVFGFFALYVPGLFVSFVEAAYWFGPDHLTISFAYLAMLIALLVYLISDIRAVLWRGEHRGPASSRWL